jgi:DNA helicase HerA-like ATPase
VKAEAQVQLAGNRGAGVVELIHRIVEDDGRLMFAPRLGLPIGTDREGDTVHLMPDRNVLVVGDSGCGKTRFAKMLTERMVERKFEFCVIDPEGDYVDLKHSFAIVEEPAMPHPEQIVKLLRETGINVVINTIALDLAGRRRLVSEILPSISELRAMTGRPHWVIVDEAHQTFPAAGEGAKLPDRFPASILITVSPQSMTDDVLRTIDTVLAFPNTSEEALAHLARTLGFEAPALRNRLDGGEVFVWFREQGKAALEVKIDEPHQLHRRHNGKYAVGDVGEWHSFYFRGQDDGMNLKAKNTCEFVEHSRLLDDAVWEYHLRRKDYSAWFRNVIKDDELAHEIKAIEEDRRLTPHESRDKVCRIVLAHYAAPIS